MSSPRRYLPLLAELDAWHDAAKATHPDTIPCRVGCTQCCRGPFDISIADAELLIEAVETLPLPAREEVRRAATRQVEAMTALEPGWEAPFDIAAIGDARFDRISDALATLPCPLLDQHGACRIYDRRPMICRLMGLPLVTESGDVIENGCPIMDQFPDYAALAPRPFPLERWEEGERVANQVAASRLLGDPAWHGFETSVAAAIVTWLS